MKIITIFISVFACMVMNYASAGSFSEYTYYPEPECTPVEGGGVYCPDPPQCTQQDIDEKEPDCQCATAMELEKLIAVHQANVDTLLTAINALQQTSAALTAAMNEINSHVEGFEYEIAGRCALAGVEAYGVGKVLTTFKATCGHLGFAAQCKAAGFTSAEVAKYLIAKKSVQETTEGLIISAISAIAKHGIPQDPKPWYYSIPIVGGWCGAYDSSTVVFTAPQALDALGRNKIRVLKEINKLKEMLKAEQDAIKQLRQQIADACNQIDPMLP